MKFKSKKSFLVRIIVWSVSLFMIFLAIKILIYDDSKWIALISILPAFFLMMTWFDTSYIIKGKLLKYKSGFINGTINVDDIIQIEIGKTMYVGLKPALSSNGCIIKYNRWDDIYVSPENQELFNTELLKINPNIKVVNGR